MSKAGLYIPVFLFFALGCFAQDDYRGSFHDFSASSRQQYKNYSERAEREFARALQENWETFNVFDAQVRKPLKPSSDTLIPACVVENRQVDITGISVSHIPEKKTAKATDAVSFYNSAGGRRTKLKDVSFDFYGVNVKCAVPASYNTTLRLESISENAVGSFWNLLLQNGVGAMAASIKKYQNELNLNDWALFEFVEALSLAVFPKNAGSERTVFTVFCMNRLGLNCKIARTGRSLIPMFASDQEIYGRRYVVVNQTKYYIADADTKVSKLNTYQVQMPHSSVNMDMSICSNPKIGGDGNGSWQTVNSSVLGGVFSLPVNDSLMSFYRGYPQMDVNVYAAAEPDEKFSEAMLDSVRPKMEGKNGVEALNALLAFVQRDFKYKTDTDQFGKEKPFFIEENFFYPYNDCEDRAVLFAFLVRKILGFDCLLLEYGDHVNCAVRTGVDAEGYFVRRGDSNYYICDPTCRGAQVGMSGKDYRIKPEKIWVL